MQYATSFNALHLILAQMGHRSLREAIARSGERQLAEMVPGKEHSVYYMLHGVIQHDLYHAGQIAVLKKARN